MRVAEMNYKEMFRHWPPERGSLRSITDIQSYRYMYVTTKCPFHLSCPVPKETSRTTQGRMVYFKLSKVPQAIS